MTNLLADAITEYYASDAGAVREVNGPYEPLARAALVTAITEYYARVAPDFSIVNFNDDDVITWKDVATVLKQAKQQVRNAPETAKIRK